MLIALNASGHLVNVLDQACVKGQAYRCPACGRPVQLKQGQVMRPHFAHFRQQACDFFQENESAEHLNLKASLYRSLLAAGHEVVVEAVLADLGQVADLLVNGRLVLEVQCSRLSLERLLDRTQAYQAAGYQVIWLLGQELWLGRRATALHRQVIQLSQTLGAYLWELDDAKQELRLRYLLHESLTGQVVGLTRRQPLGTDLLAFLRQPYASQALVSLTESLHPDPVAYVQRQLVQKNPKWLRRQAQAYEQGGNLLAQSPADFYPQVLPLVGEREEEATYLAQFKAFYQELGLKNRQTLYPPRFYAIMKDRTQRKDEPLAQDEPCQKTVHT